MTLPAILKLAPSGLPVCWVHWQEAAVLYARDQVKWEAGENTIVLRAGWREQVRTTMAINSIIAVAHRVRPVDLRPPLLTNRALFERDGHLCMYCGTRYPASQLSRDHIIPTSRGGKNIWTNVCTACVHCNRLKDDKTLGEAGMKLLSVPYEPDPARYLMLMRGNRRILADQQAWLEQFANGTAS